MAETKNIKLTTGDTPNAGFYSGTVDLGNFPTPFNNTPKVIATMASANGNTLLIGVTGTTPTSWGKATIVSNAKRENMDNIISLVAVQTT